MSLSIKEQAWEIATRGPWPNPNDLQGDDRFMALALQEALKGVGHTSPNPPVGCVLVKGGTLIGRGTHLRAGSDHAEVVAIQDALDHGFETLGSTMYTTLEPCCHTGRTPPCTDALLRAGVARVVVGVQDQNPRVNGGGIAVLKANHKTITVGVLGEACQAFYQPFFHFVTSQRPWVTAKIARGSDGGIGEGGSQVTPASIQNLAHALRRASDGIVVGAGTIFADDPLLTDRWEDALLPHREFHRIILEGKRSLPQAARVFKTVPQHPVLWVSTSDPSKSSQDNRLWVPPGDQGWPCWDHLLLELGARGLSRILIEGGATVIASALKAQVVDEIHEFTSNQPVGGPVVRWPETQWSPNQKMLWETGFWNVWMRR